MVNNLPTAAAQLQGCSLAGEADTSRSMSLIGKLIDKLLTRGSITLKLPGKAPQTLGRGGGKHLTVRFTDRKVGFDIVRNPRLAFGETYMDGRLIIEDGTILDLMEMIVGSNRWEEGGAGRKTMRRGKKRLARLFARKNFHRARRNVAHHYDLSSALYDLFLDRDQQYSCDYFEDAEQALEDRAGLDQASAGEGLTSKQQAAVAVGDREREAVLAIAQLELALVVGGPHGIGGVHRG